MLQEHHHSSRVSEISRMMESAPAITVLRLHVRAALQEHRHSIRVSVHSRITKSAPATTVRSIHIRAMLQEHRRSFRVSECWRARQPSPSTAAALQHHAAPLCVAEPSHILRRGQAELHPPKPDSTPHKRKERMAVVPKILDDRVTESLFWQEHCFALSPLTACDKGAVLDRWGGYEGGNSRPTPFVCLAVKLLKLKTRRDVLDALIAQPHFKYLRMLGALVLRCSPGMLRTRTQAREAFKPLFDDMRKTKTRGSEGWVVAHVDEFADLLVREETLCNLRFPRIKTR